MLKECPKGMVRNPKTGRCITTCPPGEVRINGRCKKQKSSPKKASPKKASPKKASPKKKDDCPPGKIRNPKTGRCITECPPGQVRINGRCKPKKPSASRSKSLSRSRSKSPKSPKRSLKSKRKLKECPPGTRRNPLTNRCKKIETSKKKKSKVKKATYKGIIDISAIQVSQDRPELSVVPGPYPPCIINSRLPLLPHQIRVVSFLNRPDRRGLIAIHDVGTGKTLTAVTASQCYLNQSPAHRVIVVTPVSLQENFKKEIRNYGANPSDPRYQFYTIQGFRNALDQHRLVAVDQTLLILDEAHNIRTDQELGDGLEGEVEEEKHPDVPDKIKIGVFAKALLQTAKQCKKVLLLTATPLINNPMDIVNLIAMVNGEDPIVSFREFEKIDFPSYLRCKTSIYKPSEEYVRDNYPSSHVHNVFIEMDPAYLVHYKAIEDQPTENQRAFYNAIRRVSNTVDQVHSPKIDWVMNLLQRSAPAEKFVVFSHFITCGVNLLIKKLTDQGIPFRQITGSISGKNRADAVTLFNSNQLKVLIISKAGGEGLDLKNTTGVVLMEPAWNEAANRQVIGRAVRYKSHITLPPALRKVDIYRLLLIKPVERAIVNEAIERFWTKNRSAPEQKLSIDLYMRNTSLLKQVEIDRFMNFMIRYSIERQPCV
jgi:SNF2 family DNA or RNA helicase